MRITGKLWGRRTVRMSDGTPLKHWLKTNTPTSLLETISCDPSYRWAHGHVMSTETAPDVDSAAAVAAASHVSVAHTGWEKPRLKENNLFQMVFFQVAAKQRHPFIRAMNPGRVYGRGSQGNTSPCQGPTALLFQPLSARAASHGAALAPG